MTCKVWERQIFFCKRATKQCFTKHSFRGVCVGWELQSDLKASRSIPFYFWLCHKSLIVNKGFCVYQVSPWQNRGMQKIKEALVKQCFPGIRMVLFRVPAQGRMILYLKYSERFSRALALSQGAVGMRL